MADEFKIVTDQSILEHLVERVERLESLQRATGDLFLFMVDTPHAHLLVVAPSVESVFMMIPNQENVEFVGVAHSLYKTQRIIRTYHLR